jgi:hypothetical protein
MRHPAPHSIGRRTICIAAVALTATAAGCGSGAASPGSVAGKAASAAPEEFGLSPTELAARIDKTEGLIAKCMTDAGFQYIALDYVTIKQAMNSDQTARGVSSDEYVKQFGLGITTQFDQPIVAFGPGPQNSAYLDGLPSADKIAFQRSLWGESPGWNHARALEAEDFSQTGGCTRSAAEQTYTPTEISGSYVNPADVRLEQDPRMIAAIKKWSECMRADGYQYDTPTQVEDDLHERLAAIVQGQDPATLTGPALDSLHELQGEELAIAALLTSCEDEHITPVQAAIEAEVYGAPQS